jgi:hypothetical protein
MSNQLARTPLLQAVTTVLGLQDSDSGLTRLAEELTIGLNPWSADNPEFALSRQDFLFQGTFLVAAGGAGFRSVFQISNAFPDYLTVLEGWLVAGSGVAYNMAMRIVTLATTDNGTITIARDGRNPRARAPGLRSLSQNNAALPAGISAGEVIADVPNIQNLSFPIVLGGRNPDTVSWYPNADNVSLRVNYWGRTRRILNARELAP